MRSGLISAVAILTILFVASAIFAIYYGVQAQKASDDYDKLKIDLASVVTNTSTGDIAALKADKEFGPNLPAIVVASSQIKTLIGQIAGDPEAPQMTARDAAKAAIAKAQKAVGADTPLPADLDGTIAALVQRIDADNAQIESLKNDKAQDKVTLDNANKQRDMTIAGMQQQIQQEIQNKQKAIDDAQAALAAKDAQIDAMAKNDAAEHVAMQAQTDKVTVAYNDVKTLNAQQKKQLDALAAKLGSHRVDARQAVIGRSEGQIVKSSSDNIVYIDLGYGDHIAPGLTFEVYDQRQPLPKLPNIADNDTLPVGKGSIEVIRVDQGSSECRVINTERGQTIVPGDKILNLVYDRNTKFNFVVYGDFDINSTGKPVPADIQIIKRLVTQWGGTIQDKITADTDFVIMGKEPEIPQFTTEELQDPFNKKKQEDSIAAADAYDTVQQRASDLGIPILNQNRFLYFVGYFDLASR